MKPTRNTMDDRCIECDEWIEKGEWVYRHDGEEPTCVACMNLKKELIYRMEKRKLLDFVPKMGDLWKYLDEWGEEVEMGPRKVKDAKIRKCLRCGNDMQSLDAGHRVCPDCRDEFERARDEQATEKWYVYPVSRDKRREY